MPFYDPTAAYRPIFRQSLASQKSQQLKSKLVDKNTKLTPPTTIEPNLPPGLGVDELAGENQSANLLDIAESSLYQGRERLFDLISGNEQTNEDIRAFGDFEAGVTPEDRQRLVSNDQEAVTESLAAGNYFDAAGQALTAAPGTLADSANVVPELIAGAGLTALTGGIAAPIAGAAIFGRRAKKVADTVDKVSDAVSKAKKTSLFTKTGALVKNAAKAAPKAAGQVSVATASITQGQISDFRDKHGVNPTTSEAAGMYAITLATMLPTPGIIKNFFVPKFKQEIASEIKTVLSNMASGSNFVNLAGRVASGAIKATKAGGAEAAQEYLQTWAETVNVNIGPKDKEQFFQALSREIGDKDNRLQALAGSFLGGGAGGTARAAISAPAVAAGVTLDVAKATVKGAGQAIKAAGTVFADRTAKKAINLVSDAETDEIREKFKVETAQHEEFKASQDSKLNTLRKTKNFNDIADETLRDEFTTVAGTDDLQNPRVFKGVKDSITSSTKASIVQSAATLELNRGGRILASEGKKVVKAVSKVVNITEEDVEKVIQRGRILGKKAIREVKQFNTSATKGLAVAAIDYGTDVTKDGLKRLHSIAKENTPEVIRKLADTLTEDMPKVSAELFKTADRQERASATLKNKNVSLVNVETLRPTVRDIVQRKGIANSPVSAGLDILRDSEARPEDLDTVETLQKALDIYKANDLFKQKGEGSLSNKQVRKIERNLESFRKVYKSAPFNRTADVVKTVATAVDPFVAPTLKVASEATKSAVAALDTAVAAFIKKPGPKTETKTDEQVVDPVTKTSYKVKTNDDAKTFISVISKTVKAIAALEGEARQEALDRYKATLSGVPFIQKISEVFETTDPDAILAIVASVFPEMRKPGNAELFLKQVETALNSVDTKPAPETVTRDASVAVPPSGSIELDEDGLWLVDKIESESDIDEAIDSIFNKDDVCPV